MAAEAYLTQAGADILAAGILGDQIEEKSSSLAAVLAARALIA